MRIMSIISTGIVNVKVDNVQLHSPYGPPKAGISTKSRASRPREHHKVIDGDFEVGSQKPEAVVHGRRCDQASADPSELSLST